MKLTINTPETGDWTVVQDEDGNIVYEGHDRWSSLVVSILEWANDTVDTEFIEWPDDVFEETF